MKELYAFLLLCVTAATLSAAALFHREALKCENEGLRKRLKKTLGSLE